MKKIALFLAIAAMLISGCAIKVMPLNDGRVPLPYGAEFNTYGSGWLWPFMPWPGVSWGYRNYYDYYDYYYGYSYSPYRHRWGPRHYR